MVTFEITYKNRVHPAVVKNIFVEMAQLTSGTYTCNGHRGTVTCPDKYVWLLNDHLNSGWIVSYNKLMNFTLAPDKPVQNTVDLVG